MRSYRHYASLTVLVLGLALVGCPKKKKKEEEPTATPTATPTPTPTPTATPTPTPEPTRCELETVYFDFDQAQIRSDERAKLREAAECLEDNSGWRVRLAGHADERGSTEYNLALGERRANAVRDYLVDLGVPSGRLSTISYGEERPAVQGNDEEAWAQNRRVEFER